MLHRGGTGDSAHPRNLDIPNKEREIRRVDNTTVIAEHYDMSGANNDYWDSTYVLANTMLERTDSTDSTKTIYYSWSGMIINIGNPDSIPRNENCNDWEDDSATAFGGGLASNEDRFFGGSDWPCNIFERAAPNDIGILCASY